MLRYSAARVRTLLLLLPFFALACAGEDLAPPASPLSAATPVIVDASFALEAKQGPRAPPGAPAELRSPDPSLADLLAALRASTSRAALAEAIGEPVREPPAAGVSVEVIEEGHAARLVVRAPDRATALVACRAYAQIALDRAQPVDPAESWLLTEIARLERQIAALDHQLSLIPGIPWAVPRSRAEALVGARVRKLEARAERLARSEAVSATFPIPRALARLAREAQAEALEARSAGRGAEHPEVRALSARAAWYAQQRDVQWIVEEESAQRVEEAILALPARADRLAVARALAARLRASAVERACSLDPSSLQVLALTHARLRAAEAELAPRYGAQHPERLMLAAQRRAMASAFDAERDTLAALIEREGAADIQDARPDDLRDQAVLLASTLARLARHREQARPARWALLVPCHLR